MKSMVNKSLWVALITFSASAHAESMSGKDVFSKNCAACHMATGMGIPGAFPALKGSKFVLGDANAVVSTVLKGRGGMPTFAASLDDDKLAAVVSYVRQSWGNQATVVTVQDVKTIRANTNAMKVVKKEQPTNIH
ncbi:c-type cytochrome [Aquirhabdus sp.]|uniref:c-type cytochrome n=1 Tax=Aquirhabdus sp. TaxID=2824160 RepID=UPI00396C361B